jgi:hypothetical protein
MADFFNPTSTAGVGPFVLGDTLSGTNFESENVLITATEGLIKGMPNLFFGSYNFSWLQLTPVRTIIPIIGSVRPVCPTDLTG